MSDLSKLFIRGNNKANQGFLFDSILYMSQSTAFVLDLSLWRRPSSNPTPFFYMASGLSNMSQKASRQTVEGIKSLTLCNILPIFFTVEPHHEKTNNVVSQKVHKPSCTSTEDG